MTSTRTVAVTAAAATLAYLAVPAAGAAQPLGMDLCTSFTHVCKDLTSQVDCRSHFDSMPPKPMIDVASCESQSYHTYIGHCHCAGLDASNDVLRELVDYSVNDALPFLTAAVTTTSAAAAAAVPAADNGTAAVAPVAPTTVTDFGAAFVKTCKTFLQGSKCPASLHIVNSFGPANSYASFKGDCSCGTIDVSDMTRDALTGYLAAKRLAATLVPSTANPANLDLCGSFTGSCSTLLTDIACPTNLQVNRGCSEAGAPASLVGSCKCGALDLSEGIKSEIVSYTVKSVVEASKVYNNATGTPSTGVAVVDFCTTYTNLCSQFLDKVELGADVQKSASNCVGSKGTNLATFRAICGADNGPLDFTATIQNILISTSLEESMPELVCLGNECAPYRLSPGVMAIIIISAVLLFVGLVTWAYQRGHAWAYTLFSNPLVNRIMSPFTALASMFTRRHAKESPADTHHSIHLRGTMA